MANTWQIAHNRNRWLLVTVTALLGGGTAAGCHAQSAVAPFAPSETHRLRDFGAVGDGRVDDTLALRRALANSSQYCLDGEGRTYRVSGTIAATQNLCLRNTTLAQSLVPFDTTAYTSHECPVTNDTSAIVDCGDPPIAPQDLRPLHDSLSVRTLFVRSSAQGQTLRVTLDHVKVDRGRYPDGGSRADAAGIWIEGADRVDLRNVEVTGYGKGYGLAVFRSRNVTADGLWVHDLVWSPYRGEAPLSQARVAAIGWNAIPIHEFRRAGQEGAAAAKFYGVRVQEQVTCALFSEVQNAIVRNSRIERCMAHFTDGDLPWQADGLDISRSSSNVTVESPVIDTTWEGMDVVGNGSGVTGLLIDNPRVTNSFGFGLKLGYHITDTRIMNPTIVDAGLAGIVIYGAASGMTVSGGSIDGVGIVRASGRTLEPWAGMPRSGLRLNVGPSGVGKGRATPHDIEIDNVSVASSGTPSDYEFGLLNTGGTNVRVRNLRANSFRKAGRLDEPAKVKAQPE